LGVRACAAALRAFSSVLTVALVTAVMSCSVYTADYSDRRLNTAMNDDSIYGTHTIQFAPVDIGGLEGCVLVYRAVQADHAHAPGKSVVIVGHIGVLRTPGQKPILALKIKVRDLVLNPVATRPHVAYLRSDSWSTARSDWAARDLVDDFRAFGVALSDDPAVAVLREMLDKAKVTVVVKRTEDDMELQFPLDLMVSNAEPIPGGTYRRMRSPEGLAKFRRCVEEVLETVFSTPRDA